jgi:HSP20 family protein
MPAKATGDEPLLPVAAVTRNGAWLPAVDVRELPDEYIVLADLPGLKPGDVDVTSDDNILTIAGARHDRLHTGGVPFRLERPTGKLPLAAVHTIPKATSDVKREVACAIR